MKVTWTPSGGSAETLCDHGDSFSEFRDTPAYTHAVVPHIGASTPALHDRSNRLDVVTFTVSLGQATILAAEERVLCHARDIGSYGNLLFELNGGTVKKKMVNCLLRVTGIFMRGLVVTASYEAKGAVTDYTTRRTATPSEEETVTPLFQIPQLIELFDEDDIEYEM